MTKEQQRIAIAEWMGAKKHLEHSFQDQDERRYFECWRCGMYQDFGEFKKRGHPKGPCLEDRNSYAEDLNAIHEAEKKLTDGHRVIYVNKLSLIIGDQMLSEYDFKFSPIHATASQRSEALCRTLWPERFQ